MTRRTPQTPQRRSSHRLLFHRRSRPVRALAALGLVALTAGYAAPVAGAAGELAEDRWAPKELIVPEFAHPQFADAESGDDGGKPAAVPEAGRKHDDGEREAAASRAPAAGDN